MAARWCGRYSIVRIQKGDKASARPVYAGIARRPAASVILADEYNARIAKRIDNPRGIVGGAVIDDDDFKILIALRHYRTQRLRQKVRAVIDGDDDRKERRHDATPRRSSSIASITR